MAYSQQCATPFPSNPTIYSDNANARGASSAFCIDVFFHIVRNSNGTNAFTLPNIDDIVEDLNEVFSPHNIIINNAGNDFIDNDELVNISLEEFNREVYNRDSDQTFTNRFGRNNVLNYFIVNDIISSDFNGFASGLPSNSLFIRHDRVLTSSSPHEVGHCLNLYHTFHGSINEQVSGSCAEAINGSNCNSCRDYVCDTPADQNLGNTNGYSPDLTNIMSYYRPRDHFTNEQGIRMRTAISQESALQNITSSSCVSISEVNNICHPDVIKISLANLSGATTTWTSSANVQITSSNNSSADFQALNGTTRSEGWIRASLNNGIELTERFWINRPLEPSTVNGASSVVQNAWEYYETPAVEGADSYTWVLPSGWSHHHTSDTDSRRVLLVTGSQSGYVRVRANNVCGVTNFKSKYVTVSGGGSCGSPVCYQASPNPSSSTIKIQAIEQKSGRATISTNLSNNGGLYEEVKYILYNFNSEIVAKGKFTTETELDVSAIKKGRNLLKILTSSGTQEKHIVIK